MTLYWILVIGVIHHYCDMHRGSMYETNAVQLFAWRARKVGQSLVSVESLLSQYHSAVTIAHVHDIVLDIGDWCHWSLLRHASWIDVRNQCSLVVCLASAKSRSISSFSWVITQSISFSSHYINPCEESGYTSRKFPHSSSSVLAGTGAAQQPISLNFCGLCAPTLNSTRGLPVNMHARSFHKENWGILCEIVNAKRATSTQRVFYSEINK